MKTTHDLIDDLARYCLEKSGASKIQVEIALIRFRREVFPKMNVKLARPLTDECYTKKLEGLKKEAPDFLDWLASSDLSQLPKKIGLEDN